MGTKKDIKEKEQIIKAKDKIPQQMIVDKFSLLMRMNIGDLLAFFDLVNAVASGATHFITNNDMLVSVREKITERIKKFKIITPEEANKILSEKDIIYEQKEKQYIG